MHLIGVDAEPVAEQLLVDRLVPLPLGDRARQQGHGAAAVEADLGRLEAARRGALDRVRDAEAAQFAAAARLGAALLEPGEIGEVERHVEALLELAAIVGEGQPDLNGIASGGIMLRRRNSTGSMPSSAAARSTMRSMT